MQGINFKCAVVAERAKERRAWGKARRAKERRGLLSKYQRAGLETSAPPLVLSSSSHGRAAGGNMLLALAVSSPDTHQESRKALLLLSPRVPDMPLPPANAAASVPMGRSWSCVPCWACQGCTALTTN